MLITITILLIHATKSCLPDKILDTLIDDEEYELFQGILGELDNLDLLDDVEHAQYEADEVREPVTVPATQIEDTTTEDYIVEDSVYTEDEVVDDVVSCTTEYEEICKPQTSGYTTTNTCSKWPHERCTLSKEKNTKVTPVTGCHKEPIQLCAPAGCTLVPGPEHCHDEVKTIVQDKPREECSLEPQRTCKHVTKLVPKLSPTEECVDVPKEVCTRSRTNPRKVKKPVVKKWCYVPSEESGLA